MIPVRLNSLLGLLFWLFLLNEPKTCFCTLSAFSSVTSPALSSRFWISYAQHQTVPGSAIIVGGYSPSCLSDVWLTTNSGSSWSQQTSSGPFVPRYFASVFFYGTGNVVLAGGDRCGSQSVNDVWSSSNYGVSWTRLLSSAPFSARENMSSYFINNILYIAGGGYYNTWTNDVWSSSDFGSTWNKVSSNFPTRGNACALVSGGKMLALGGYPSGWTSSSDVWISADLGVTWTQQVSSAGWSSRAPLCAILSSTIYVVGGTTNGGSGTSNDVWTSTNNGASWIRILTSAGSALPGIGTYAIFNWGNSIYLTSGSGNAYQAQDSSSVVGDPTFVGFQHQIFQFHGVPDQVFNLISMHDFQMNAYFTFLNHGRNLKFLKKKSSHALTTSWTHPGTYLSRIGLQFIHEPKSCNVDNVPIIITRLLLQAGSYEHGMIVSVSYHSLNNNPLGSVSEEIIQAQAQVNPFVNGTIHLTPSFSELLSKRVKAHKAHNTGSSSCSFNNRVKLVYTSPDSILIHSRAFTIKIVNADGFFNIESASANDRVFNQMGPNNKKLYTSVSGLLGHTLNEELITSKCLNNGGTKCVYPLEESDDLMIHETSYKGVDEADGSSALDKVFGNQFVKNRFLIDP